MKSVQWMVLVVVDKFPIICNERWKYQWCSAPRHSCVCCNL